MLNLTPIRVLKPQLLREALEAALRVCAPEEADDLVLAMLSGIRRRSRLQTLESAAIAWERLSPESRRLLVRYAGRRLSVLVENLSAAVDPRRRRAAARLISVSSDPALRSVLLTLVGDSDQVVSSAAAEEILGLVNTDQSPDQTKSERFLVTAADQFHLHRRVETLAAVLARAARPGPELHRWLDDESQPAHMALRSMVRRDTRDNARADAIALLARSSFAPAALDRLRRRDSIAQHDAALRHWALLRHPRRRRALLRAAQADTLLPAEADTPALSPEARLGRVHLIGAVRLPAEARAAALAPCLTDESLPTRLAAVATLGAGALSEPEAQLLRDFTWDHDERVARSASVSLFANTDQDAPDDHWLRAAGSAHASVRDLAALAPSADPLRTPISARLALLRTPDRFIIVLRARIARAPAPDRLRAIAICRRLNLAPRAELELLAAAADADPRVSSAAVRALAAVPGSTAREVVVRLADHPDARVRANAVEAARGRAGVASMIEAKLVDPHHRVRSGALVAWFDAAPDMVCDRLRGMLADERPDERLAALWATGAAAVTRLAPDVARCARDAVSAAERRSATRCARTLLIASQPLVVPFMSDADHSGPPKLEVAA